MSKAFNLIIFNIECLIILISFLISLKLIRNKSIPDYMRGFYWYPTIALIIIIPGYIAENYFKSYIEYSSILNNISLIFHYTFLSIFIIKVMPSYKDDILLKFVFGLFLLLLVFHLTQTNTNKQNTIAFVTANFGLTIFCLIYYYRLFNNLPVLNLLEEPSFWIITGVFFCMGVHIPLLIAWDYLHGKIPLHISRIHNAINIFCYIIMHLFFIKAILCSVRPQRQS